MSDKNLLVIGVVCMIALIGAMLGLGLGIGLNVFLLKIVGVICLLVFVWGMGVLCFYGVNGEGTPKSPIIRTELKIHTITLSNGKKVRLVEMD